MDVVTSDDQRLGIVREVIEYVFFWIGGHELSEHQEIRPDDLDHRY